MLMHTPLARERRRPVGFIVPCAPTLSDKAPSGPRWISPESLNRSFPVAVYKSGMSKKRAHPRSRGIVGNAVLTTEDRAVPCSVRDLSPGGARLSFRDINLIPREFELVIKSTGETHSAQLRWRSGNKIGVAFVQYRRGFGRRTLPHGAQKP